MTKYLIKRPIGILLSFIVVIIFGLASLWKIPVSLLPNIDVPRIVILVHYPNTAAFNLEQNIIRPIRESLGTISHIEKIESRSANHYGIVTLIFEYGTKMNLAYIESNEKLDQLSSSFPRDMQRPIIIRTNTSDIPIIRVQVTPKSQSEYLGVSELSEKILRKRLEQVEGVSVVDISGQQHGVITVTPYLEKIIALNLDEDDLTRTIQNANKDLGGMSVRDGQYRYFIKVTNALESADNIARLPITTKNGTVLQLQQIAKISWISEKPTGFHLFNNKEGLVLTIQKQPDSRMNELVPKIKEQVRQFTKDYPNIDFSLSQDQSFLLEAGISNLYQDLIYGGILTILLLFLFLGNWVSPFLMSISIPTSLIITFIFFYLFDISFNIISLSGLALGIGMLIDNSIVVIDSISRKRKNGMTAIDSAINGTNEVIVPVISQVLTTVAVYLPLILLSGVGGALVFDQSIALTISLCVSLLVAFILVPILYKQISNNNASNQNDDSVFYKYVSVAYHKMIDHILRHNKIYLLITISLMPIGIFILAKMPVNGLPKIERKESMIHIDWNSPIDANENLIRTKSLLREIQGGCNVTEAEIGIQQFTIQQEKSAVLNTELYYACDTESEKTKMDQTVRNWIENYYPNAFYQILDAPNAFTQLFSTSAPFLEARFKPILNQGGEGAWKNLQHVIDSIKNKSFKLGDEFQKEIMVDLILHDQKMALYGVTKEQIETKLHELFGNYTITNIKRFGEIRSILLKTNQNQISNQLATVIQGNNNAYYPLNQFITISYSSTPKYYTSDKSGQYKSINFGEETFDPEMLQKQIKKYALDSGYNVQFVGRYIDGKKHSQRLWYIFFIVLILLYTILVIQYENLIQPFLVMLTIPLGITGGAITLWLAGGTLDIMAIIGFVVILGLIVDDPILKIDTLNKLENKYLAQGLRHDKDLLYKMIHEAGDLCLKPLLMVSLTTSIALVPVLFVGGIGNDMQKPLAIVIIGGLTVGTFFTTWFIPLAYWYFTKWKNKIK
ncbi:efflux RND transporter permease subunit [Flavihumibacter petaseus]|uniref:Putative RND-type efflux pump membrane protein n=1 Tax=Flavihumibacter petaseus NBRC 106054 TaxID=1220578 RepID=A0A0E9MX18_9BACT|nr:efflux RND transporter permease subunit [Flavihumibacter petaseus]GAO41956.1 putative RND-type efflux pump membrane protein [Flavihumibacter petaseus NBRC 106054]